MFYIFLILICINEAAYASRAYYSKSMCESKSDNDCTFQMNGVLENSCHIYNTSVCKSFDFSEWTNANVKYPKREALSSFSVSIEPYAGKYNSLQPYLLPAINVKLNSEINEINGFVLEISEIPEGRNMCRIFDYRNVSYDQRGNVSLFYDCLNFELVNSAFLVVIQALPINQMVKYEMNLPDAESIDANTICQWKSLILIYLQSLEENVIEVKFSKAPTKFNVTKYVVTLYSAVPYEEVTVVSKNSVAEQSNVEMLSVVFDNVDIGYYCVSVLPVVDESCDETKTDVFFVPTKLNTNAHVAIYVSTVFVMGIIIIIVVLIYRRWNFKSGNWSSLRNVLIVPSKG